MDFILENALLNKDDEYGNGEDGDNEEITGMGDETDEIAEIGEETETDEEEDNDQLN